MSGHGDQIDPPPWDTSDAVGQVVKIMRRELGGNSTGLSMALAYLIGDDPIKARHAILLTAHDLGKHTDGKCPEHCPRF